MATAVNKLAARVHMTPTNYVRAICATVAATSVVLCALAVHFGRDLNFDFLNYHLYVGLAAGGDRIKQDFFPAGIQSYLSPYSYIPLYWLVRAELSSNAVVAILALIQSLIAIPVAVLCMRLNSPSTNFLTWLWMFVMALATPVLLIELGNTFNDLGCSVFTLLGLVLALPPASGPVARGRALGRIALSGTLTAVGIALKLSLVPVSVAIPLVALIAWQTIFTGFRDRILVLVCWGMGACAGLLVAYGPWGYLLWQEFGNPVFPFFNSIFQSPYFPPYSFSHERFKPQTVVEFLTTPFALVEFARNTYTEVPAPDARPLAYLLLALIALPATMLRSRLANSPGLSRLKNANPTVLAIHVYILLSWLLWLSISGNGRYALPLFIVIGFTAALWTTRMGGLTAAVCTASLALAQVACIHDGMSTMRWSPYAPHDRFVALTMPEDLKRFPAAYVSVEPQSSAYLAHFVHGDSSFVNVLGAVPLPPDGPVGARLQGILAKHTRHYAVMSIPLMDSKSGTPLAPPATSQLQWSLRAYGLDVEAGECLQATLVGAYPSIFTIVTEAGSSILADVHRGYWFCPLRVTGRPGSLSDKFSALADRTLDAVERKCPALGPAGSAVSVRLGEYIVERTYVGSDTRLRVIRLDATRVELFSKTYGSDASSRLGIAFDSESPAWKCPPLQNASSVR